MRLLPRLLLPAAVAAVLLVGCSSGDPEPVPSGSTVTVDSSTGVQDSALGYLDGLDLSSVLAGETAAVPYWCCEDDGRYLSGAAVRGEATVDDAFVARLSEWAAANGYQATECAPADLLADVDTATGALAGSDCRAEPGLSASGWVTTATASRTIDGGLTCELAVAVDPAQTPRQGSVYLQCLGEARR
jgi:hypothetical protein